MSYNIVQCPACGNYQATSAKVLKCKYCNKSKIIISKKGHQTVKIAASYDNPQDASRHVQEMNAMRVTAR